MNGEGLSVNKIQKTNCKVIRMYIVNGLSLKKEWGGFTFLIPITKITSQVHIVVLLSR